MKVEISKPGLGLSIALVLIIMAVAVYGMSAVEEGKYDGFAQCLTEKGFRMYGSVYCGHCEEQKKAFGSGWQYIDYVECSSSYGGQTDECFQSGIRAYPTWVLPDGTNVLGRQSFEELSRLSGCELE